MAHIPTGPTVEWVSKENMSSAQILPIFFGDKMVDKAHTFENFGSTPWSLEVSEMSSPPVAS